MNKAKIKYQFSIKSNKELNKMTQAELLKYIKNLQKNIVQEKPAKNSTNSGIPTSKEIVPSKKKKNQSLRRSGGKNGGQFGRKGITLKQIDTPDETIDIEYSIYNCKKCEFDLSKVLVELKEKRQVLDLDLKDTNKRIMMQNQKVKH